MEPTVVSPMPASAPEPMATPQPVVAAAPTPVSAPVSQPVVAPPVTPQPTQVAAPIQKTWRILLVEDDDALANVYLMRLEAEGFDVYRVSNGEDALVSALQYHPDIMLLDVMMPRVSGFEVLDIIRNTPETANLKVIMLTALSQEADKERANKLGVDDYLVKSQVVIADVVARIKYHLGMN